MLSQRLTTSQSFRRWINVPETTVIDDTFINELIDDASIQILSYIERPSLFKNTLTEYYDGTGTPQIMLRQWPVLAVNSVYDTGNLLTASVQPNPGYFLNPWDGMLPGRMQTLAYIGGGTSGGNYGYAGSYFSRGIKNIAVNYTYGYAIQNEAATIPATAPYTIKAIQPLGPWGQDDGLTINGVTGTAVKTIPTTGQYSVTNTGTYTFAAADTGKAVVLNYSFIPSSINQACNKITSELYNYRQHIGQKSHTVGSQVTTGFDNSIMTQHVINKLQPYKRMVPW